MFGLKKMKSAQGSNLRIDSVNNLVKNVVISEELVFDVAQF